jgi:hypothetical protein
LYLSDWSPDAASTNPAICAGTPLILSNPKPISLNGIDLHFDDLSIVDYQQERAVRKMATVNAQ